MSDIMLWAIAALAGWTVVALLVGIVIGLTVRMRDRGDEYPDR